ncbi:MAG: ribosome maturation factor RimP [Anaerovoracaceae bacterium]
MSKNNVKDMISQVLETFLPENQLELYNVEFLKEGKDWFLRVYIDKIETFEEEKSEEEYVSIDDCEKVSRFLSEKLDETDPIEQNYYLEVSSAGMDRILLEEKHYKRFAGKEVEVSLYKAVDGTKKYQGILVGLIDGDIVIKDEKDNEIKFPQEQVAKTRLAVVF